MVVPPQAIPVPDPPYVYYLWPDMINDSTPTVRLHIMFGGDPDLPCACHEGVSVEVQGQVRQVLDTCRGEVTEMMRERGWKIRCTPETIVTCSHDYDPRSTSNPR